MLGFALRDSAGGAPNAGAARTRGGTLAGGATRIRGASGSERPRAAMNSRAPLPEEIYELAQQGDLQKVVNDNSLQCDVTIKLIWMVGVLGYYRETR